MGLGFKCTGGCSFLVCGLSLTGLFGALLSNNPKAPTRPRPVPGARDVLRAVARREQEEEVGSAVRMGTAPGESSERALASSCCCGSLSALTAGVGRVHPLQISPCSLYQFLIESLNAQFYGDPESGS